MKPVERIPLLVGEVFVDFTLTGSGEENKLRLGGIVHAARAFWALNVPFGVAVVLPSYLEDSARTYLQALGCCNFWVLGEVSGAPNLTIIHDATEVADQEYETILRGEKTVRLTDLDLCGAAHEDILVFPGTFSLEEACRRLPSGADLHIDVAYDVEDPSLLERLPQAIRTILMSTSSPLFRSIGRGGLPSVLRAFEQYSAATLIFKENRGGARMTVVASGEIEHLPAQLGSTANSVGVGDVFAAAYVAHLSQGRVEAGWRATYAAAAYSQTTYPDLFKNYLQRDLMLSVSDMRQLSGVSLAWESRPNYPIYLAAPDFSYGDRRAIDRAIASLDYHHFSVRRPIKENGELPVGSSPSVLQATYHADYDLLKKCALVFAVPTGRDPGTLVEIGIAIEAGTPVVVFDPNRENANTMVMAGTYHYASDLDSCLNAVFSVLSAVANK
jgi:nucleoside 2-deoxyribosyltransferase/sugar/nucleoside kinase (ribokinase family)